MYKMRLINASTIYDIMQVRANKRARVRARVYVCLLFVSECSQVTRKPVSLSACSWLQLPRTVEAESR